MLIRRTLIWGVIMLVLLGVALPGVIGWIAAARVDDIVARLARPGLWRVAGVDFDRGWFVSNASIRLQPIGILCSDPPCPALTLASRIHQGPIAWGASGGSAGQFAWAVITTRIQPSVLWPHRRFEPALTPIRLVTWIALDTQVKTRLNWPGGSVAITGAPGAARLDSQPIRAYWTSGVLGRGTRAAGVSSPAFSLVPDSGGRLAWQALHVRVPPTASGSPLAVRANAGSITLDNGRGRTARLRVLHADIDTQSIGRRWNSQLALAAGGVSGVPGIHGPLRLDARLRRIDWVAWAALPNQWSALDDSAGEALDDPRLYHQLLPHLLAGGVALDIDRFNLATDSGPLRARFHVHAPPTLRPVAMAADVISQLDIMFNARLPARLLRRLIRYQLAARQPGAIDLDAERIDRALADLVSRGLIAPVPDKPAYRITLRIRHARLTLNGKNEPGWQNLVDQIQATAQGL